MCGSHYAHTESEHKAHLACHVGCVTAAVRLAAFAHLSAVWRRVMFRLSECRCDLQASNLNEKRGWCWIKD